MARLSREELRSLIREVNGAVVLGDFSKEVKDVADEMSLRVGALLQRIKDELRSGEFVEGEDLRRSVGPGEFRFRRLAGALQKIDSVSPTELYLISAELNELSEIIEG
jgi:hypothetical protein